MPRKKKPNDFDAASIVLQDRLKMVEQEVVKKLPMPFGSLEKAIYTLKPFCCYKNTVFYRFVTTVHNTEDAIEIMKIIFNEKYGYVNSRTGKQVKYFAITKTVEGVSKEIYRTERFRP